MADNEEKPEETRVIFTRIERLTKEGHELFQDGDFLNSYLTYEKAVDLARQTNEAFTIRACFFNLGACCVAKGEASKGLEFLLRAVPPDKESDGSLNFADLHYNMAVAYDVLGTPNDAKRCYEIAQEGYKECSNLEMEGEVLLKLAGTLTTLNLLNEAVNMFSEGEKVFQKLMDDRHAVLCLSSRATLLAEMKNEECQELLKTVVHRVEELKNDLLKAKVYSDAGLVYTSTGQYEDAAKCLDKSLNLIQSTNGDHKLEASVCQNLGAVYNQLRLYEKAIIYHEKAFELYGFLGMRFAQGHCFSNLAFAFGQLGELEKSKEFFLHALQAAKDCQDYRGQWQANEGLSAVYVQQKEYDKAVSCLKAALAVLAYGGVRDRTVHDRIVAKLSNTLESQLTNGKQNSGWDKTVLPLISEKDNVTATVNVDGKKVGHIRPREKNHKLIARGLEIEEHVHVANDETSLTDSTFDSISSYSGSESSIDNSQKKKQVTTLLSRDDQNPSKLTPVKKDPLNNTYEEPQDIIHVLKSGRLRLHDLPPGPRDTVLASMNTSQEQVPAKTTAKSRTCVIQ